MKRKNEQSIGEIIREYLKVTQLENHVFESRIAEVWQEALGDGRRRSETASPWRPNAYICSRGRCS